MGSEGEGWDQGILGTAVTRVWPRKLKNPSGWDQEEAPNR